MLISVASMMEIPEQFVSLPVVFLSTIPSFADLPQQTRGAMGRYFIDQMALIAELEAGLISERTKAVLSELAPKTPK
jgi:hypothetical protein